MAIIFGLDAPHVKVRFTGRLLTNAWNSVRGNSLSSWLNMLQNPLTGGPPVG